MLYSLCVLCTICVLLISVSKILTVDHAYGSVWWYVCVCIDAIADYFIKIANC